ncbi:hypothetical protein KI387_012942, partial [Taxus chinensis]
YKPKSSCLSRYLIALLNYGGVPNDFFMKLVNEAFDQIKSEFRDRRKAFKVVKQHKNLDENHVALRMLACGIPLNEPLLQYQLKQYMLEEIKKFKEGKIPIDESFYLMGTADPTGQLKSNEVCVLLDHGQVSGDVLVYKNPGLHFGDIHVFQATYVKDIEYIVGDSKFAIFFSTRGPRSAADEIANSDFDGDLYWVSMNANLLKHFKPSTAWERPIQGKEISQPKPTDFSYDKLEEKLIEEFFNLRFAPSNEISLAADSWLVFMDRLLTPGVEDPNERKMLKEKMLRLTDIYYEALDAPKSGKKVELPKDLRPKKRPHFLNKTPQDENLDRFYISCSVLGKIYDVPLSDAGSQSDDIWTIQCFQDVIVPEFKAKWKGHYTRYRSEMVEALNSSDRSKTSFNARTIIQKYKQILYGATSLGESSKPRQQIYLEASALYQVVYEFAQHRRDIGKCAFAWKVAGEALCDMYLGNQQQETILISPPI